VPLTAPTTLFHHVILSFETLPRFDVQHAAALTVPGGPSVACSTPTAVAWDEAWAKMLDPSGRAATGVHDSAYMSDAANGVDGHLDKKQHLDK
jgi:asparagine synthase (glutamine-hydrolysing)